MIERIEVLLNDGSEKTTLDVFEHFADMGETRIVERKSIQILEKIKTKEQKFINNAKEKISRTISALSNYEGGVLLFGVDEKTGEVEEGIDDIYGKTTIREWLLEIVSSCVSPPIEKYVVKAVNKGNGVLYILIAAPSEKAPHQANDGRYYGRIEGKNRRLDGQMVQDIWSRKRIPIVRPYLEAMEKNDGIICVAMGIVNNSQVCAEDLLVIYTVEGDIIEHNNKSKYERIVSNIRKGQRVFPLIYPEIGQNIIEKEEPLKIRIGDGKVEIKILLTARNCPKKIWEYEIAHNKGTDGKWWPLISKREIETLIRSAEEALSDPILQEQLKMGLKEKNEGGI